MNSGMKTVIVMFLCLFTCAVEGETERGWIIIFLCGKNFLNMKLTQSVCGGKIFDRPFTVQ